MSLVISIILYKLPKYMDFLFRHMDNSVKKNIAIIGRLCILHKNKFIFVHVSQYTFGVLQAFTKYFFTPLKRTGFILLTV